MKNIIEIQLTFDNKEEYEVRSLIGAFPEIALSEPERRLKGVDILPNSDSNNLTLLFNAGILGLNALIPFVKDYLKANKEKSFKLKDGRRKREIEFTGFTKEEILELYEKIKTEEDD